MAAGLAFRVVSDRKEQKTSKSGPFPFPFIARLAHFHIFQPPTQFHSAAHPTATHCCHHHHGQTAPSPVPFLISQPTRQFPIISVLHLNPPLPFTSHPPHKLLDSLYNTIQQSNILKQLGHSSQQNLLTQAANYTPYPSPARSLRCPSYDRPASYRLAGLATENKSIITFRLPT